MLINGTWNGGSVTVEKKIADDSWRAVATVTDNDFFMVESVGPALFRTNTVHGGSAPSLVCDVEFAPLSTEYKYGVSGTVRLA